ncbi:MAG: RNA polymerase sigma factor [Saprospiraceae bacterium]|nr:RNA polymerase sigma factor [Saprospiraceae bacterium]
MFFAKRNFDQESDESLMQAVANGNERAFAALYDRYSVRIHRFFVRMLQGDFARAEDLTQDLFLKVIEKAGYFDPEKSFRTWLYVLAYNLCKNEFRRPPAPVPMEETVEEEIFEKMDRELFDQRLRICIDHLGETHQTCFVLRYQEGLSILEIAEIIGCPEGTVKSRLHHALRQVCAQMEFWIYERKN